MAWKKIDPANVPVWNQKGEDGVYPLKEGDELVANFVDVENEVGPNNSNLYTFKKEDGSIIAVWGSQILDSRFKNLVKGEQVKITYLGLHKSEKTAGRSYHNYEVWHDDGEEAQGQTVSE